MKTIIQLLIVALIINACYQSGRAYYQFYDFKDRIEEEAQHGRLNTTSELHNRIIDMAAERGITMQWDDVRVSKETEDIVVDFHYVDTIPFVPRFYMRPWVFEGSVSTHRLVPLRVDELR